jgi:hypothetical protein
MKTTSFSISYLFGYLIARLNPLFFPIDTDSWIGKWHKTNGIYKFAVGTTITLRARNIFGFGVRPIGIVKGYDDDGNYIIDMSTDENGNFFQYMANGLPPDNVKRVTKEVVYSKNEVEFKFKLA